jgi:hypothetical protein
MIDKPLCSIPGCNNVRARNNKHQTYRKLCTTHHRLRYGISNANRQTIRKKLIDNNKCIQCGWLGPCDRHRVEHGGEYIPSNVLVLCPNCHRLLHFREWGYIKT